jgi:N6-adenosine-specific RNA methylase IME4
LNPAEQTLDLFGEPCAGSKYSAPSGSPVGRMLTFLPSKSYKTIVIDPPWPGPGEHRSQKGGGVTLIPYQTMTGIQIASMRIKDVAVDGAQLWLWASSRSFVDAGLLMNLWGFAFAGMFIWKKPGPTLGPWIRNDSEFLLRGVLRGAKAPLPAPVQTWEWPRPKRHSEKPPEAYRMIEHFSPGPRLDIFARQARPGFDAWGNEAPAQEV